MVAAHGDDAVGHPDQRVGAGQDADHAQVVAVAGDGVEPGDALRRHERPGEHDARAAGRQRRPREGVGEAGAVVAAVGQADMDGTVAEPVLGADGRGPRRRERIGARSRRGSRCSAPSGAGREAARARPPDRRRWGRRRPRSGRSGGGRGRSSPRRASRPRRARGRRARPGSPSTTFVPIRCSVSKLARSSPPTPAGSRSTMSTSGRNAARALRSASERSRTRASVPMPRQREPGWPASSRAGRPRVSAPSGRPSIAASPAPEISRIARGSSAASVRAMAMLRRIRPRPCVSWE